MKNKIMKNKLLRIERTWAFLFITPSLLQFICFFIIPVAFCIYAAFTDWNVLKINRHFIGLDNFSEMLKDKKFWIAIGNTFYMMMPIPIYLFLSLLFALGCHRGTPGNKIFRTIYYLPYISSIVALVVIWKWLFNYEFGIVNNLLFLLFSIKGPNWLSDPKWIKNTMVIMISWKLIGITSIYYLAALKNIPESYFEAAKIDGASSFQQFKKITLPLITPITFYLTIIGVIGSLQTFIEVQLFTNDGGRDYSAATIVYYVWQKAFVSNTMGYACSVAAVFGIFILLVTAIQFKFSRQWVFLGD
jgi:multiple sugar transport system permease protein